MMIEPLNFRSFQAETDLPLLVQLRLEIEAHDKAGTNTTKDHLRDQLT